MICSDHEKVLDDIGTETAMLNPFLINSDFFRRDFLLCGYNQTLNMLEGMLKKDLLSDNSERG